MAGINGILACWMAVFIGCKATTSEIDNSFGTGMHIVWCLLVTACLLLNGWSSSLFSWRSLIQYHCCDFNDINLALKFLIFFSDRLLVLVGGTNINSHEKDNSNVTVVTDTTICATHVPTLPATRIAGFAATVGDVGVFCGGRESLMSMNSDCWKLDPMASSDGSPTWIPIRSLPSPVVGAAAVGVGNEMWVFGGVFQHDYYDDIGGEGNGEDYYDYVTEESGRGK